MKPFSKAAAVLLCAAVGGLSQNVSSSVRANIVDASGAAVISAACILANQATGTAATVKSDEQGVCTFNIVQAGSYSLTVKASGFKVLETREIIVTAGETRTLGRLALEVGGLTETVQVTGEVSQIQLATAEKSGTISQLQLQKIAVKGRDMFAFMTTVPGIVDNFSQARETASPDSLRGTFINGGRENAKNFAVDGITALDTGSNNTVQFEPNMDAIAEVKVLTSNYQAEYGRNSSGTITIITRGGGRDLHASAYDTYRHESLNATNFFDNRNGTRKSPYRYRITGYNVGGPVYIPKIFPYNKERDKLFFFWSQEYTGQRKDYGTRYATMPTQLERGGDFSQSFNTGGKLITIYDPLTPGVPFPDNKVPSARFNSLGLSMLNFFPLPNWNVPGMPGDPDVSYKYQRNYRSQYAGSYPKREDMVRIDFNPTPTTQIYWRYIQDKDEQQTPWGMWVNGSINWNTSPTTFGQPGKGHVVHVTKTFASTWVNEFIFGKSHNNLYFYPTDAAAVDRAKIGNPAQWFKDSSCGVSYTQTCNYMANIAFGGQPANTVNGTWGNIPYENFNDIYSFVDNISKLYKSHNFKAGVYIERTRKFQVGGTNPRGTFNFSTNANNPYDTGNSFANALIGQLNTYSEATVRANGDWRFMNYEFYVQDNWRVNRRLTLDIGVRFYHLPPQTDNNKTIATMDPSLYSRANAPLLYRPILVNGSRKAVDPNTGQIYPNPYIGLFIPGTGNAANGAAIGGVNGYPGGLYKTGSVYYGPRLGFAWDVFGTGKTAVRGGFGVFPDRMQGNPTMNTNGNPPVAYSPTLYFGTLDSFANSGGLTGPTNINALLGYNNPATTLNWSFGVQQQVGHFAIDVAYVGSASYHLAGQKNINPIAIGARFDPNNYDPSQPGAKKPLSDNFLRPYFGWGDINLVSNGYNSNYNSLQVSVSRRFVRGLQLGGSFVHSRTLGVADGDTSAVSPYFAPRMRNYGPLAYDRPNQAVINYVYELPNLGTKMHVLPAKWVLDNWEVSGLTSFVSGSPFLPSLGWTSSTEVTGSTEGARLNRVASCTGDRTFYQWFNTSAFTAPAIGTPGNPNVTMANFGNTGPNVCRNPGTNNWDLSISKRFPLFREGKFVQFRTEMFNVWNHTQYSGVSSGTSFSPSNPTDPAAGNKTFGQINAARTPRQIELSVRVSF